MLEGLRKVELRPPLIELTIFWLPAIDWLLISKKRTILVLNPLPLYEGIFGKPYFGQNFEKKCRYFFEKSTDIAKPNTFTFIFFDSGI